MPLPADARPGYRPRAPTNDLKDIVEDHLEELLRVYDERFTNTYGPMHPRVKDCLESFIRCGDPHFGFLRLRCPDCGHDKILPFSCKTRGLCASCGQKRAIAWAERMVEEVLPDIPYLQLVFTIPKMLRKAFLFDRSLYGELSKVAYASTREFFREHFPALDDPIPAMIVAPQSFGNLLNPHAHLHGVSSLGVFDRQGTFHAAPPDLDFSPLQELFGERTLKMMLRSEKISEERVELLRSWKHSGFNLNTRRRVEAGNRESLESLLQYIERPPVSLERLSYRADGMVHYQGKFHPGLRKDHQLTSGVEFLAMLLPHIALRYEVTIRYYGALSTTKRKKFGWIEEKTEASPQSSPPDVLTVEEEDSDFVKVRKRNWARLIQKVWCEDPEVCPKCGAHMRVLAAISSPAQDDVIERILRCRNQWHPPWERQRFPRGPPRQLELFGDEAVLLWDPEDENQDPPGDWWLE